MLNTKTTKSLGIQCHTPICWDSTGKTCSFLSPLTRSFFFVNIDHEVCSYEEQGCGFRRKDVFKGPSLEVRQLLYSTVKSVLYACGHDGLFLWETKPEGKCVHLCVIPMCITCRLDFPVSCMCSILEDTVLVAGTPDGALYFFDSTDQYAPVSAFTVGTSKWTVSTFTMQPSLHCISSPYSFPRHFIPSPSISSHQPAPTPPSNSSTSHCSPPPLSPSPLYPHQHSRVTRARSRA